MPHSLRLSGVLPAVLAENSRPGDWSATLNLSGDLAGLIGVELIGPDALDFQAALLPGLAAIRLSPGAPADYEALVAADRAPVLSFGLRFHYADGSVLDDPAPRSVTVTNLDDTPPSALAFASGGTVVAGTIGAVIGTLAVTDVDTTGPFFFSFTAADDWRFEVVGNTLRLKSGISLGLDDIPHRPLIVQVSDGHQSAAFTLDLHVLDPNARLADLPAGETRDGFGLVSPTMALTMQDSRAVARVDAQIGGDSLVTLQDGGQVVLPAVQRIRFSDGFQDIGPASAGVRAEALFQALTGHAADPRALAGLVAKAEAGVAWTDIAAALPGLAGTDAAAVTTLYHNALGRDPGGGELAAQVARLAGGVSRAQVAVDLALGNESLGHQPAGGVWVAAPLGTDDGWHAGTGGLPGAAVPVTPVVDHPWLM